MRPETDWGLSLRCSIMLPNTKPAMSNDTRVISRALRSWHASSEVPCRLPDRRWAALHGKPRSQMKTFKACRSTQRGAGDLDRGAAADVAAYVAAVRGPGAPCTMAAECCSLSPAFLADVWQVCVLCPLALRLTPSSSNEQWPARQCAVRHTCAHVLKARTWLRQKHAAGRQ